MCLKPTAEPPYDPLFSVLITHLCPQGAAAPIDDDGAVFAAAALTFCPDSLPPAASELLLMLLHIAQWDVCCDGDEAAAAAQSDAQAQLLFQGLGSCLVFMNDERLSIPRVCLAPSSTTKFVFPGSIFFVAVLLPLLRCLACCYRLQCWCRPLSTPFPLPSLCHFQHWYMHSCTNLYLTARVLALDASSFATVRHPLPSVYFCDTLVGRCSVP
jgi:hypothetical protein